MKYINLTRDDVLLALKSSNAPISYSNEDRRRILSNPNLSKLLSDLQSFAKSKLEEPTYSLSFSNFKLYEEIGNRSKFQKEYFSHRAKLESFALMAWIYEDEDYLHALEDAIWAICDEYSWPVPAHMGGKSLSLYQAEHHGIDLFAAETGQAFAEILSLLGDKLHPTVVMRMKKRLEERIFGRLDQPFAWKEVKTCNWAAVCAGSVGMAAMYEIEDAERLADILMICFTSMDRFIGGYTEDGVCTEGISYWGYGFGYFKAFADLLIKRTGGKINLFDIPKVHLMATFIGKVFFPGGRNISFSDGGSRTVILPSDISFIKTIYPDMSIPTKEAFCFYYPEDTNHRFALALRTFIEMQSEPYPEDIGGENTHIFPAAQWYLSTAKSGVSLAAKAGHNAEAHNHNDVGSFQIFKNGEQILADIGAGVYDKFYFGENRYSIFCAGSQSHNVPIINGKTQKVGREFCAENTVIDQNGLHFDFQTAYGDPNLQRLHRDLVFDNESGTVMLEDDFTFSEIPTALTERFVTEFEPKIGEGSVLIDANGQSMELCFDASAFTPSVYVEHKSRGGENFESISYCIDFSPKHLSQNMHFSMVIR